jgi:hypothetical protein
LRADTATTLLFLRAAQTLGNGKRKTEKLPINARGGMGFYGQGGIDFYGQERASCNR